MIKRICCLFAVGIATVAFAEWESVTSECYPDADTVVVSYVEDVEYATNGSYVVIKDIREKILTEKGRRESSVAQIGYNERYGKTIIEKVTITGSDGVEREIDVSATTAVATDNSSSSMNIYDPLDMVLTCTIPGLSTGDVLRIVVRDDTIHPLVENSFSYCKVMESSSPIISSILRIKAPKTLPLCGMEIRHSLTNVVKRESVLDDGSFLYEWTATNSPQFFSEPSMPPMFTQVESVNVSTFADWKDVSSWYWEVCLPHIEKASAEITNQVEQLGRDYQKIYEFVAQKVRYMGLTLEDKASGYAPHDVDITFANRYGVCRDKAALLVAMLRIAGCDAYPALVHVGAKLDSVVPMPLFNHAIVAMRVEETESESGWLLMDPTDNASHDLMPSYLSDCSYLVACPEGDVLRITPSPSADHNIFKITQKGRLEMDGSLSVHVEMSAAGINDNAYRHMLLRQTPTDRVKSVERFVKAAAPGAEIADVVIVPEDPQDRDTPMAFSFTYRMNEALVAGETSSELTVPMFSRCFGVVNILFNDCSSLEKRKYPLSIMSTAKVEERAEIDLAGICGDPVYMPKPQIVSDVIDFNLVSKIENGIFIVERKKSVNKVEFSSDEYLTLREQLKQIEIADRRKPEFAKNRDLDADVHELIAETSIDVHSPTSWTVRCRSRRKVLTEQGKRDEAEIIGTYNPSIENIDFISGVVSNADGRVSVVGERERNTMDADWVSAAPRYPASRKLVVNLPSVEIGSVIENERVTEVTNSPIPFSWGWFLDCNNPADMIIVDYRDYRGSNFVRQVKNPRRIRREPMMPDSQLWRDAVTVSFCDIERDCIALMPLAEVEPFVADGASVPEFCNDGENGLKAIRDWMVKNVKVMGPSLYEIALDQATTPVEKVLTERYASALDYSRTLCALVKGAGYDAKVVFAAAGSVDWHSKMVRWRLYECPSLYWFSSPLVEVTLEGRRYFIGLENEYVPLGACHLSGCWYVDPSMRKLRVAEGEQFNNIAEKNYTIVLRENGAADIDFEQRIWGVQVGAWRKRYAEMLGEERSRRHQQLLNGIAQGASATSDLITDTESYPSTLKYSAYISGYATASGDAMMLSVPEIGFTPFKFEGRTRFNPIGINAQDQTEVSVKVVFPKGYIYADHLPTPYEIRGPESGELWFKLDVSTAIENECLVVTLKRTVFQHGESILGAEYFAHLKELSRKTASRTSRLVSARKR